MAALRELPGSARCVIIGGGVGGTSIAYHLAQLGWEDVVLVDRSRSIRARTSSQPGVSTAPSEQACTASGGSDTGTAPIRQSMSNV